MTTADVAMAKVTSAYWVSFAKTGNPNGGGRPRWPRHDAATDTVMNFTNAGVFAQPDPIKARLDLCQTMWSGQLTLSVSLPRISPSGAGHNPTVPRRPLLEQSGHAVFREQPRRTETPQVDCITSAHRTSLVSQGCVVAPHPLWNGKTNLSSPRTTAGPDNFDSRCGRSMNYCCAVFARSTGHSLFYSATSGAIEHGGKPMKSRHLKLVESTDMRPVASKGRKPNAAYRVREHLTEDEMARLLAALKAIGMASAIG